MEPLKIKTRKDYDDAKGYGFEPLIDDRFELEHSLRVSIQNELFGTGHTPEENDKFYRFCWKHLKHVCLECMKPLKEYSATYVSHNLTRGAYPEMAHDPRNVTILCFEHHNQYEQLPTRKNMRIYAMSEYKNQQLKREYGTD